MDKQEAEAGLSPCCVVYDTGKQKKKGGNEDTILQTHRLVCGHVRLSRLCAVWFTVVHVNELD